MGKRTRPLVVWMAEEGMAGDLERVVWEEVDMQKMSQEIMDHWERQFERFFLSKTKAHLYEEAVKRGIVLFPVSTPKDILSSSQLLSRDYVESVQHPELDKRLAYPGSFMKSTLGKCELRRRAPLIGEHNEEIYCGELGLSLQQLSVLKANGVI